MIYQIEKPDLSKISKERTEFLNKHLREIYFKNKLEIYSNENYYAWDKIKYQHLPD
jgi:hypothetical protein